MIAATSEQIAAWIFGAVFLFAGGFLMLCAYMLWKDDEKHERWYGEKR